MKAAKSAARDKTAAAVKNYGFKLRRLSAKRPGRCHPRRIDNAFAKINIRRCGHLKRIHGRIGFRDARAKFVTAACLARAPAQPVQINRTAPRMQIKKALSQGGKNWIGMGGWTRTTASLSTTAEPCFTLSA